jgi:hypothetical protein
MPIDMKFPTDIGSGHIDIESSYLFRKFVIPARNELTLNAIFFHCFGIGKGTAHQNLRKRGRYERQQYTRMIRNSEDF